MTIDKIDTRKSIPRPLTRYLGLGVMVLAPYPLWARLMESEDPPKQSDTRLLWNYAPFL